MHLFDRKTDRLSYTKRVPLTWKSRQFSGPDADGRVLMKRSLIISGNDVYSARIVVEYKYRMRHGEVRHIGKIEGGKYVQDVYDIAPVYSREYTMGGKNNNEIEAEIIAAIGDVTESFDDSVVFYTAYPPYSNSYNAVF